MGASRADKEQYSQKLKELFHTYRKFVRGLSHESCC